MDQEIMEGIVLSYTKILKEIKEIREKIDTMLLEKSRAVAPALDTVQSAPGGEGPGRRGKGRSAKGRKGTRKNTEAAVPCTAGPSNAVVSDFFKKLEDSI